MRAVSLLQLSRLGGAVTELLLPRSSDLVCNNLFCEKVTGPCLCRLERALQAANPAQLRKLDLSGNRLTALPPFVTHLSELRELDLSDNAFKKIPKELIQLTNLQHVYLRGNPCAAAT